MKVKARATMTIMMLGMITTCGAVEIEPYRYPGARAKLMQAWGIGSALIMGGTGAGGAYASSALNREVCEQRNHEGTENPRRERILVPVQTRCRGHPRRK